MKTTTAIKITTVTLVLLIVGIVLDYLTIKNYSINWSSFGTALCANVCILCCELDKKKREDAAEKETSVTLEIR
jgi:hypothetical protein